MTIPASTPMLMRMGTKLALPALPVGRGPVHIAIAGPNALAEAMAVHVLRQGYGWPGLPARVSVLSTGGDAAPSARERIQEKWMPFFRQDARTNVKLEQDGGSTKNHPALANLGSAISALAHVDVLQLDLTGPDAVGRQAIALQGGRWPVHVLHVFGGSPGAAEALAREWKGALLRGQKSVPLIVVYDEARSAAMESTSGMLRFAFETGPEALLAANETLDRRARALHERYLANERSKAPSAVASPAAVEWQDLAPESQEDNRNAAAHFDYKLQCAGLCAVPAPHGSSVSFTPDEIERVAECEHNRWWSAKLLDGWRYGPVRDNAKRLHPSLINYCDLPEPEKEKDREIVRPVAEVLGATGEGIARLVPVWLESRTAGGFQDSSGQFRAAVVAHLKIDPARIPLVWTGLGDAASLGAASVLDAAGYAIGVIQTPALIALLRKSGPDASMARQIIARARRMVFSGPADGSPGAGAGDTCTQAGIVRSMCGLRIIIAAPDLDAAYSSDDVIVDARGSLVHAGWLGRLNLP